MNATVLRQPDETQRRLAAVYAPIAAELAEAERIFAAELGSRSEAIQRLVTHCADFRGKRLRPALVLLSGKACGSLTAAHTVLAAVVEMLHTASLVHDDILDEAVVRRHAATVNAEWGNESAVLLGDYLFTHAFHLATMTDSILACRWLGHATNLVCEGELQQVVHRGDVDLDEATYFEIIRGKTAALLAVSGRLGAHFAGASEEVVTALENYGRDLGVAFQIVDDLLDLCGDERTTGKTLGTDLDKQKLTLPLIHLLATGPADLAADLRRRLTDHQPDRKQLRPLLEASGALAYAWDQAHHFAAAAESALELLGPSPARDVLRNMARCVVERAF